MILLGIDTCGSVGTVALARATPGQPLERLGAAELSGRSTAALLVPSIQQLLFDSGVPMGEIAGLVAVDGPGSFTGIRIGLSTAKALAEACSLPVFAISRLRVLTAADGASCAALDAGRGEFFFGCYAAAAQPGSKQGSPGDGIETQGEWLLTREQIASRLGQDLPRLVVCEPQVALAFPAALFTPAPTAFDAIQAALPEVLSDAPANVSELDGRYLRRSDLYSVAPSVAR